MYESTAQPGMLLTRKSASLLSKGMARLIGTLSVLNVGSFFPPFIYLLIGLRFVDQPTEIAFPIFQQHSATVLISYYVLAWNGLLLITTVLLLYRALAGRGGYLMGIATVFGVLGGLMQTIGDLRWPFLLPFLANSYFDPHASQATRSAIAIVYKTMDQFGGILMSEHLYYLFIGAWTLLVGRYILRSLRYPGWIAWAGILSGCGLLLSSMEQFEWSFSPALLIIVSLSRILWSIWLLGIAAMLVWPRTQSSDSPNHELLKSIPQTR